MNKDKKNCADCWNKCSECGETVFSMATLENFAKYSIDPHMFLRLCPGLDISRVYPETYLSLYILKLQKLLMESNKV
jgi:hypothetical protein